MKTLTAFIFGVVVGVSCFMLPWKMGRKASHVEKSVAQIIYQKVNRFHKDIDLDTVLALIKDYTQSKIPFKDEQELYEPILELEETYALAEMMAAVRIAEECLASLQTNPAVKTVVPDRVLVETLEEGSGELISLEDPVKVYFKEFGVDGKLLKDAINPFTIPLSQTIKGFQLGLAGAKVGEKRKIYIHPEYGFGRMGRKSPNKLLIYEVTIVEKISQS